MDKVTLIKIGGSTLGSHDTTIDDIVALQRQGRPLVVVHGGGKVITDWLTKLGVQSKFVKGERVTDQTTLEVVISMLAGLVNKDIVASINSRGGRAVGIAGVDGSLVEGKIGDPEKGYVGTTTKINPSVLTVLMDAGFVPVVAPVGLNAGDRKDTDPASLNFNADVVAGDIAAAIKADKLIFLTDVAGILDADKNLVPKLTAEQANAMISSGVASGGMIPKLMSSVRSLSGCDMACIVDGRQPHALVKTIEGDFPGTYLIKTK